MPAAAAPSSASATEDVPYVVYGAAETLMRSDASEVVISGPAGTGKSRVCLEKLNYLCETYPGLRCLMVRKTRRSLTESGMVTLEQKVLLPSQRVVWNSTTQQYRYPNGSIIAVGGLDKPGKVMSSEWDIIYPQEATELTEHDWEALTTRLRNGKGPYHQLIGDCNPDAPTHWLLRRAQAGKLLLLESRHEDNPTVTPEYLAMLDNLTGVRYLRLRLGIWAAAEGIVYDMWNRNVHLVSGAELGWPISGPDRRYLPPPTWPRYLSVDFGYTNPFVAQWWAQDPDGRLYRYREIYMTRRLVEDHAADIKRLHGAEPLPYAIICDPEDAEGRATITRVTGWSTYPANKTLAMGIQAVSARLRLAGDSKPRLYFVCDALVERDAALVEAKKPTCTEEEMEGYVWNLASGRSKGEEPVDRDNHGLDAARYAVAYHDLGESGVWTLPSLYD